MVDYGLNAVPLFVAGQAALAEDDEARVYFHVQKTDEVARVGCDDRKVVFYGLVPDVLLRFPGQTNMGHGLRVQALRTQFAHQCRRNVFVQQ